MRKSTDKALQEHREAERASRETEAMIHRICEALSGTCVMMHECKDGKQNRYHDVCTANNCSTYRAAFNSTGDA